MYKKDDEGTARPRKLSDESKALSRRRICTISVILIFSLSYIFLILSSYTKLPHHKMLHGMRSTNIVESIVYDGDDDVLGQWKKLADSLERRREKQSYCVRVCEDLTCCDYLSGKDFTIIIHDTLPVYSSYVDSSKDVTLVAHGSYDRLDVFNIIATRWHGPLVFAMALNADSTRDDNIAKIKQAAMAWGNVRVLIYINAIGQFPINSLRNVVIDYSETLYVLPLDVDFIPSIDLYDIVKTDAIPYLHVIDRGAIVVPHFESWPCKQVNGSVYTVRYIVILILMYHTVII